MGNSIFKLLSLALLIIINSFATSFAQDPAEVTPTFRYKARQVAEEFIREFHADSTGSHKKLLAPEKEKPELIQLRVYGLCDFIISEGTPADYEGISTGSKHDAWRKNVAHYFSSIGKYLYAEVLTYPDQIVRYGLVDQIIKALETALLSFEDQNEPHETRDYMIQTARAFFYDGQWFGKSNKEGRHTALLTPEQIISLISIMKGVVMIGNQTDIVQPTLPTPFKFAQKKQNVFHEWDISTAVEVLSLAETRLSNVALKKEGETLKTSEANTDLVAARILGITKIQTFIETVGLQHSKEHTRRMAARLNIDLCKRALKANFY